MRANLGAKSLQSMFLGLPVDFVPRRTLAPPRRYCPIHRLTVIGLTPRVAAMSFVRMPALRAWTALTLAAPSVDLGIVHFRLDILERYHKNKTNSTYETVYKLLRV
jgi:hypothetical protein